MSLTRIFQKQYCQEEFPDLERDVSEAIEEFEYKDGDGFCKDLEGTLIVTITYIEGKT